MSLQLNTNPPVEKMKTKTSGVLGEMWICWYASVCVWECVSKWTVPVLSVDLPLYRGEESEELQGGGGEEDERPNEQHPHLLSLQFPPLVLCSSSIAPLHLCTPSFILIWSHPPPPPPLALYLFFRSMLGMCSPTSTSTSTSNPSSSPTPPDPPITMLGRLCTNPLAQQPPRQPCYSEHYSLVPRGWHQPRHL